MFLIAPVIVVVFYSFNSQSRLTSFGHPSLRWYAGLVHNTALLASIRGYKLKWPWPVMTTVVATVLGTLLAFGLSRSRTGWSRPTNTILLLTLVTPEIATATSAVRFFPPTPPSCTSACPS